MTCIFECKSLTNILCESIIEQFEEENIINNMFIIPKNSKRWEKIERMLYKELLIKINEYKLKIISEIDANNDLIILLNETLYVQNLIIQKIDKGESSISKYFFKPNRYNVLTYVFFLNDIQECGEIIIKVNNESEKIIRPKKGLLVLFPENIEYPYKCIPPKTESQYIITGQLCYDNIL
jgi:hypothetical protein